MKSSNRPGANPFRESQERESEMKKLLALAVAACGLAVFCTGCASGYGVVNGYGGPYPGLIFSETISGSHTEPTFEYMKRPYEVLGHAEGEAEAINVLFVYAGGDSSCGMAESNALRKFKDADALINRTFSVKHFSVLSLFNRVTNRVSGDAIRYLDSGKNVK